MFIVLQARCVGWKQNTGKTGMVCYSEMRGQILPLEIVKARSQGHNGTNLVTVHSASPSSLIPAL